MTIWTSDEVLAEFSRFRSGLVQQGQSLDARQVIAYLERLILTIRRDLGHKNTGLAEGDILSVFITDAYKFSNTGANKPLQPTRAAQPNRQREPTGSGPRG